jgi:asparagine synthase (glutamine-hydrolysing)
VPFCDHRLVEYEHNTPWGLKTPGGDPKGLLERATRGIVPRSLLERRKSPCPTTADELYEKDLRTRTRTLLEHPQGHFDTQLRRSGLETALCLDRRMRKWAARRNDLFHSTVATFHRNCRRMSVAVRGSWWTRGPHALAWWI